MSTMIVPDATKSMPTVFPIRGRRVIRTAYSVSTSMARFGWLLLAAAARSAWPCRVSGSGLLLIGLAGLFMGWAYSAPPLRLSRRGLGELSVGLGFGLVIPLGAAYVQLGRSICYLCGPACHSPS